MSRCGAASPVKIDTGKIDKQPPATTPRAINCFSRAWLSALLIAAAGFLVHVPSLQGQFIWDDEFLARDNPIIKSPLLALEAFRHRLFLDSFSPHYRPVQNLTLMVDYFFWDSNTFGFHLTNVLLQASAGVLLYFLLRRIFDSLGQVVRKIDNSTLAFVVALIWVVHPVHSAAVDYISGRADSLAFCFACGGWLLFLRGRAATLTPKRVALYSGAVLAALAALCSRETAFLWIVLFFLHLSAFDRTATRRLKALSVTVCSGIVVVYAGLRHLPPPSPDSLPTAGWTLPARGMLILRAFGDYARLIVFPANLHMERTVFSGSAFFSEPAREAAIEFEYLSILGALVMCSLGLAACWRGPAQRARIFGGTWFIITILPVSNIVDLNATVAEHWIYLPSVGAFIFLVGCLAKFRLHPRAIGSVVAVVVVSLSMRSLARSSDWLDAETFYERTAAAGGTSCRVMLNLGQIYSNRGEYAKAETLFRNILRVQPDYLIALNNLSDCLTHLGRTDEAKQILAEATSDAHEMRREAPRTWLASVNYARVLESNHDRAGALAVLQAAQRDYPDNWDILALESELYRRQQNVVRAIELVRPFAEKTWWHYTAWMALGRLYAEKGDVDLAENALRHASWLDVRSTEALNLIALVQMRQNRLPDAFAAQRRAVARQPEQPHQYVLLSNILDRMGRVDEARAALVEVSRLRSLAKDRVAN